MFVVKLLAASVGEKAIKELKEFVLYQPITEAFELLLAVINVVPGVHNV